MLRVFILTTAALITLLVALVGLIYRPLWLLFLLVLPLVALGIYDMIQREHAVLRNFPIVGHGRYLLEAIRPEIQQYFIESDINGRPFSREQRSVVYQRSKGAIDTLPFGTRQDYYAEDYTWLEHSLAPQPPVEDPRVVVGEARCAQPYSASVLNISAMSYGALSKAAIEALNGGAKDGNFAHNTGEGGVSPYHLAPGGDLIWQIGTGYFGCRTPEGSFNPEMFGQQSQQDSVKMIEIKLSQGAKPGHGGILPAGKVTPEIAAIRHVPMGQDVLSPPAHSAFSTPIELLEFVGQLRERSGGKPVGFKLCVGRRSEFLCIVKAMLQTQKYPDFITIDGGEGGTGAAPLEFSNALGWPLLDSLSFVHNSLVGANLRDKVRIAASGRIVYGFDLALRMCLGADFCYSARAMMFSLGCIQALRCNTNNCPTGVATQDPALVRGLDIKRKRQRVAAFHDNTVAHLSELVGAAGLKRPADLNPSMFRRRVATNDVRPLSTFYPQLQPGQLLASGAHAWSQEWSIARPDRFS